MKFAVALILVLAVVASAESTYPSWVYDSFEAWSIQWDKNFEASPSEKEYRVGVFYSNLKYIEETNAAQDSYTLALNGFSAMTVDEFLSTHTGLLPKEIPAEGEEEEVVENVEYPVSVDWVSGGAVTGVKNQGQCGSCWSFSTTGGLEGLNYIKNKKLISLSEQQLVDCSGSYGNYGCNGGLMDSAFKYTARYGSQTESSYPYKAVQGSCQYSSSDVVFKNKSYKDVTRRNPTAFLNTLAKEPISIAIDAEKIMSYNSGIFSNTNCGTQLDHGVLAVGYDTDSKYIKVKNSWGTTWGESGYIRFSLLGSGSGECGMYLDGSVPTTGIF